MMVDATAEWKAMEKPPDVKDEEGMCFHNSITGFLIPWHGFIGISNAVILEKNVLSKKSEHCKEDCTPTAKNVQVSNRMYVRTVIIYYI